MDIQGYSEQSFNMLLVDESSRASGTLESLFRAEFKIESITPLELDERALNNGISPNIILYVCKNISPLLGPRVTKLRKRYPKAVPILLMPSVYNDDKIVNDPGIPAHKVIFRPCTKQKITDTVYNYISLLQNDESTPNENVVLSCLMEFIGSEKPELYVAYNRVSPLIMTMCQKVGYDWRHVQATFNLYMMLLSHLDEELLRSMMAGEGRKAKAITDVHDHLSKMVELLSMHTSTEETSTDLKYIMKRYNGDGLPKDAVQGQEIPPASRIIRLLFDYHYLLQSGKSIGQTLFILKQRTGWYDEVLIHVLLEILGDEGKQCIREVYPLGLVAGMVIAEDVYGIIDGKKAKIIHRNAILSERMVGYLQSHCETILDITEPIKVIEELF